MKVDFAVIIHPDELRRIVITCVCKHRNVYEIPRIFSDIQDTETPMVLVVVCANCHQKYGCYDSKVCRLTDNYEPETGNALAKAPKTVEGEVAFDGGLLEGKVISPGSNKIN